MRVVDRGQQSHLVQRVLFLLLVEVTDLYALQRVVLAVFPFDQQLLSFDFPHRRVGAFSDLLYYDEVLYAGLGDDGEFARFFRHDRFEVIGVSSE